MGEESKFLRQSSRVVYEQSSAITDAATGEHLRDERQTFARSSTEPDYIKLYYKAMMAVSEIKEIPLDFLLALSAQLGWASEGSQVFFYNNKTTRRAISDYCSIGDNMTAKYIKRCVGAGVLFPTCDRGTYEVNPWLIAKGKWDSIKQLQASFEFVSGKWQRCIKSEKTDAETGATTATEEEASGSLKSEDEATA